MLFFGTTPSQSHVPVKPEVPSSLTLKVSENFLCICTRVTCRACFKHRFLGTLGEMAVQLVQNRAQVHACEQVSLFHSLLPTPEVLMPMILLEAPSQVLIFHQTFQLVPACVSGEVGQP